MLLRAEVWWIWHLLVALLSYHLSVIPAADWVLLGLYLTGNYAYIAWIRGLSNSTPRCVMIILLSQLPILVLGAFACAVYAGTWYCEPVLVGQQLMSAVYYPLTALLPSVQVLDARLYLWAGAVLLMLQSIVMLVILCRMHVFNDPNNSYIERDDPGADDAFAVDDDDYDVSEETEDEDEEDEVQA